MTTTIAPTVEADNTPPRVRLNITDTGTPAFTAVTVMRLDPDGVRRAVRTLSGGPLALTTSGADRVGLLYDYEAPYGVPLSYSTQEAPDTVSVEVTINEGRVWLVHPGVPELSMPIDLRAGSFDEESWDVQRGVYWPMGRAFPVVQTDGIRKAAAGSVTVAIESLVDLERLRTLVFDTSVLLLNVPAVLGFGVDTAYVSIGAIRNRRISDIGEDPYRAVELPFQVVDPPAGGTQAERTFADITTGFATFADVKAAYATFFDLLTGP